MGFAELSSRWGRDNTSRTLASMRASGVTTPESTALSKALKQRGWSFVGPTTCYALMQAMGMVNDHIEGCAYRAEIEAARATFVRPVVKIN